MIDIGTDIEYLEYAQELYNNAADIETKVKAIKILVENTNNILYAKVKAIKILVEHTNNILIAIEDNAK
jgi:hypothetical protein